MKTNRNIALLFLCVTAGLLLLKIILAFRGHYLEHVSGTWAALAVDLTKGIFYRPLFDETLGTGGTRWMPLYFVLHGALIKLTGNVLFTGLTLSLFSSFLLISAFCLLLKHYKTDLLSSIACLTLLLCSNNIITAMTAVRGDILAAALNIWGLYFAVTSGKRPCRIVLSCLLLSLTIMTKITSGFGIASVVIWLYINSSRKHAFKFAGLFTVITMFFIIIVQATSSGRFLEIFTLCASGGTTFSKFIKFPLNFIICYADSDPGVLIILTITLMILVFKGRKILRSQYALLMTVTLAITLFIFGSEGIEGNHLIDVHIMSVLVIAGFISEYKIEDSIVIRCSLVIIIIACMLNAKSLRYDIKKKPMLSTISEMALSIDDPGTLVSENPWIPILMKKNVFMVDPFMLRIIDLKNPELLSRFYFLMKSGEYKHIIFKNNPALTLNLEWYETIHFGSRFMVHTFRYYRFSKSYDDYYIYTPAEKKGSR